MLEELNVSLIYILKHTECEYILNIFLIVLLLIGVGVPYQSFHVGTDPTLTGLPLRHDQAQTKDVILHEGILPRNLQWTGEKHGQLPDKPPFSLEEKLLQFSRE